ncbi:MAG: ArnT family glycosyltransferase [Desulfovibrionaceae bacterium]
MTDTFFGRRPAFWATAIICATTLVRFWFVATHQLDLVQDEAQYWDWTRHLQLSYYSKGPLIAWCIALGSAVCGNTELGVRIMAVAGSLLIQIFLYRLMAVQMGKPRAALVTLVIANGTPLFLASGVLMTTDNPLLACWLGAMCCLHAASRDERNTTPLVLLALCMAVGVLAKYMMLAFLAVAAVYMVGLRRHGLAPRGFYARAWAAMLLGAAIGFLPILAWNMGNDWVGFRHVAGQAGVAASNAPFIRFDRFPEYMGSQIGLLTPWWFAFMLLGAWGAAKAVLRKKPLAHFYAREETDPREPWLLAPSFWLVWGFFLVWSFHKKIYPNWSAVSYAGGLILAGLACDRFLAAAWPRRRKAAATLACLACLVFGALHLQNWLPLPDTINPTLRLKGWSDLGQAVDALARSEFPDPQRVFFFGESYTMTAALAFYAPGQPHAYCADFGRRMNQYDLWSTPDDDGKKGWDAIFVRKGFDAYTPPLVPPEGALFDTVRVIRYQTKHRGQPARKFTIWLCRNYHGPWPAFAKDAHSDF